MSTAGRPRTLLALLAVGATASLTSCLPAPPPAAAPAPTTTAAPAATTTTTPAGTQSGSITGACAANTPDAATVAAGTPDASALSNGEVATAARDAASAAIVDPSLPGEPGDVPVVVTSVDDAGRPTVTTLDTTGPTDAAADATAYAQVVAATGGDVVAVEPDQTVTLAEAEVTPSATATDPARSSQWALDAVHFEDAWPTTTGAGVCVAILDTGVQLSHPDLAGRIAGTYDLTSDPIEDGYGHGTHVAGIVAADADNGIGVAGGAPGADLLIVKVLGDDGSGTTSSTANGVIWAVDHGAQVVNLSLGSTCPAGTSTGCNSAAMSAAMDYAQAHDVLVVAAAGNDGTPGDPQYNWWSWPAAYDWPIAVAAVDSSLGHSTFSTQADYVDVAAPGTSILSTAPTHPTEAWSSGTSGYGWMSGTSMATPYVTALVAVLRAAHPTEDAQQIRDRITGTAVDLGDPGWDASFGLGLIDVAGAVA